VEAVLAVCGIVGLITGLAALAELVWKPFRRLVLHRKSGIERLEEKVDRLTEYLDGLPTASNKVLRAAYEEARRLQLEGYHAQRADKHREAIERFTRALALAETDSQRAALHILRGNSLHSVGDWSAATDDFKTALGLSKRISPAEEGDRAGAAALGSLGLVYADRGDLERAERYGREALQAYRRMDDPLGVADALGNLGNIYRKRGELCRAEEQYRQILDIHQQFPDPRSEASALTALGNVCLLRGRLEKAQEHYNRAEEHYSRALNICRRIDYPLGQAYALMGLGSVQSDSEHPDGAEERYKQALEISRRIGYPLGRANALCNLGLLAARRGHREQARRLLAEALALYERMGAGGEGPDTVRAALRRLGEAGEEKPRRRARKRKDQEPPAG
jgi:tetratricopeptide (TPR) repeat protein